MPCPDLYSEFRRSGLANGNSGKEDPDWIPRCLGSSRRYVQCARGFSHFLDFPLPTHIASRTTCISRTSSAERNAKPRGANSSVPGGGPRSLTRLSIDRCIGETGGLIDTWNRNTPMKNTYPVRRSFGMASGLFSDSWPYGTAYQTGLRSALTGLLPTDTAPVRVMVL